MLFHIPAIDIDIKVELTPTTEMERGAKFDRNVGESQVQFDLRNSVLYNHYNWAVDFDHTLENDNDRALHDVAMAADTSHAVTDSMHAPDMHDGATAQAVVSNMLQQPEMPFIDNFAFSFSGCGWCVCCLGRAT